MTPRVRVRPRARPPPEPRPLTRPYLLLQLLTAALQALERVALPPRQHLRRLGAESTPVARETTRKHRDVTPSLRVRVGALQPAGKLILEECGGDPLLRKRLRQPAGPELAAQVHCPASHIFLANPKGLGWRWGRTGRCVRNYESHDTSYYCIPAGLLGFPAGSAVKDRRQCGIQQGGEGLLEEGMASNSSILS